MDGEKASGLDVNERELLTTAKDKQERSATEAEVVHTENDKGIEDIDPTISDKSVEPID
ncbi:unnamed protein product, partial [Cuscuta epithymum]